MALERKLIADAKAKAEADAKIVAKNQLKAKKAQEEAKAASELKAKQAAAAKAAALKKITITCVKGEVTKRVTGLKPKCPPDYKLKKRPTDRLSASQGHQVRPVVEI